MKKILLFICIVCSVHIASKAQLFIDKATIEFEVKTNVKKTIGGGMWAEMMKENMPQFKTGYYKYIFSGSKSVYKFDRWDEKGKVPEFMRRDDEQSTYFFDHANNKLYQQKSIIGAEFLVQDSLPKINWRLTNESRLIAGFNCRKAIGIIQDSVYVFAFYTEEIVIPGGPCTINGLPGMILGLTIPRMYTSYIATKIVVTGIDETILQPIIAKKYSNRQALKTLISERAKEWSNDEDEDSKAWKNQFIWNALL